MERGFLSQKESGGGRGLKEKKHSLTQNATIDTDNVVPSVANVTMVQKMVLNDVNTNTVNLVKPPKSNKRDDINFNANVEPTPSASLPASMSFATVLKRDTSQKSVNFHTLIIPTGNEADVVVLLESIRAVSERFANAAYGLFWESGWLTSFSKDRLDAMLENGPWFIRNNRLILKKWNPNVNFSKEDVANVPVWVKLHGVPMTTFSEDGL
ncbi:retrovirus-related pol polyprotein from transposon TNT 1-94, partial [Tanacetum coccineum]